MPANVTENRVEVWNDTLGIRLDTPRKTTGYTAWCDECTLGHPTPTVNWHGNTYPVGYFPAPAFEARLEAERHNESCHDPDHVVSVVSISPVD